MVYEYKNIISKGDYLVDENKVEYNSNHDFTSLEAWKKPGIVKLFFYDFCFTRLPNEEDYHFKEGIQFYRGQNIDRRC